MRCPYCNSRDNKVMDSRATEQGTRRRRECTRCAERFTTIESVMRAAIQVVKKDGRREEFQREKLLAGLRTASQKREIPTAELDAIVADIEAWIGAEGRTEVQAEIIGELAMDALRQLDHIAYIRFASVYRSFADLDSLVQAVDDLQAGRDTSFEARTMQLPLLDDEQESGRGPGDSEGDADSPRRIRSVI